MNDATTKTRRKRCKPLAPIDYAMLAELCGFLCTGEECASVLGVSYNTLVRALKRDHDMDFPTYFKRHSAPGLVRLRQAQFEAAEGGSIPMLIWLGKQYLGQREPDKQAAGDDVGEILRQVLTA